MNNLTAEGDDPVATTGALCAPASPFLQSCKKGRR